MLPQTEQNCFVSPRATLEAFIYQLSGTASSFPIECIWPGFEQDALGRPGAWAPLTGAATSRPLTASLHPRLPPACLLKLFGPVTPVHLKVFLCSL